MCDSNFDVLPRCSISDRTYALSVLWRRPIRHRTSPTRGRSSLKLEIELKLVFKLEIMRRPIPNKSEKKRGDKGWLQSVGTLVRHLWRAAGSGAKARSATVREIFLGPT